MFTVVSGVAVVVAVLGPVGNIVLAILGIGGLIFVHELGHFLVGRMCGVRAEAFSIGFGPVVLRWQPGPTEYRLSALPLGGYVKFLGENPDERDTPEPDSFVAATYTRKAAIMLAGVAMNVVAAFALFAGAFSTGVDVVPPIVGSVVPGLPAWEHGVQAGDEIVTINGARILDFSDVVQDVAFAKQVDLVVRRGGDELPPIRMPTRQGADGLHRIGVAPSIAQDAVLGVLPDSPAQSAGFRSGDVAVSVDGSPVTSVGAALAAVAKKQGPTQWEVTRDGLPLEFELPHETKSTWRIGVEPDSAVIDSLQAGGAAERAGIRVGDRPVSVGEMRVPSVRRLMRALDNGATGPLTVLRDGEPVEIAMPAGGDAWTRVVRSFTFRGTDGLVVSPFMEGGGEGPAHEAGLPAASRIVSVDGKELTDIGALIEATEAAGAERRALDVRWEAPDGAPGQAMLRPVAVDVPEPHGLAQRPETRILRESGIVGSAMLGLDRTHRWVWRILDTLGSLFTGDVSPTKLSGPLKIAEMSYDTAKAGWGQFMLFLGMISVNLAVLNILPIPMLDGGQLAVLTIEKVRGKPLPENVLLGIQWAGLIMLLGLMVFVVANDIINMT